MVENVILVGAGASYGAGEIYPTKPPLGKDLFEELESSFPELWGSLSDHESLPDHIREEFDCNFEKGMVMLSENDASLHAPLYQALAAFFTKFSLGKDNHYNALIDGLYNSINNGETVFVSLNYDLLLEEALKRAGFDLNLIPNTPEKAVTVIKPHGSCNFLPKSLEVSNDLRFGGGLTFGAGVKCASREDVVNYYESDKGLYPVMALYRPDKHTQISPSVIESLQQLYRDAISEANTIGIIGVGVNPQDGHIWDPLATADADIHYIGGRSDFEELQSEYRDGGGDQYISKEFGNGIDELIAELD